MWHFIRVIALCGCLFAIVGTSANAGPLSEKESRALLNGTTWKIGMQGRFTGLVYYWDWKPDGSVCGRLGGAKKDTPCAEVGQWKLEGNRLCWRYNLFHFFSYGYKAACVRIEGTDERKYLTISERTGNLVFAFFVVE